MKKLLILPIFLLVGLLISCGSGDDSGPKIEVPEGYTLIWSDEFSSSTLNADDWSFETGNGQDFGLPPGWGNNELQIYTSSAENIEVTQDGSASVLAITAISDGSGGYTSSKITTNEKVSVRYGRIDVRAKMPQGQGIWPAIWMMGDNRGEIDWPGCGEIDIAEVLGSEPNKYYSTLHYTNGENGKGEEQVEYTLPSGSFSDDYHVFSAVWTDESISFLLDDVKVGELTLNSDMKEFQRSFYLIMNVAVGGYWPGNPDNTTTFPQTMFVDYVRVFGKKDFNAPPAPPLDLDEETLGGNLAADIGNSAIREDFTLLGDVSVVPYGGGGEPNVYRSNDAIDGTQSLSYNFPGTNWGGAYFELASGVNLSSYTNLRFSLRKPSAIHDAEIKLESPLSNAAVFLENYTATSVSEGFIEYVIPLSDFSGLDLTEVHIPFAMWNPVDEGEAFAGGEVLIDNLYFE